MYYKKKKTVVRCEIIQIGITAETMGVERSCSLERSLGRCLTALDFKSVFFFCCASNVINNLQSVTEQESNGMVGQ